MDWLKYDVRLALRDYIRRPGLALVMIGTLAIGMGVNAVAFGAFESVFFRSTRTPNAESFGWLFAGTRANPLGNSSLPAFQHFAEHSKTLRHVAAEGRLPVVTRVGDHTEQAWAMAVSDAYFTLMPARPVAGRLLVAADQSSSGLPVVLSERFWRSRFEGTPALSDIRLTISSRSATVVGVMPDSFEGPGGLFEPDFWLPLAGVDQLGFPAGGFSDPESRWLTLFGEPAVGATPAAVEAEILSLANAMSTTAADAEPPAVRFVPLLDGHPELSQALPLLFGVVLVSMGLLLLVACFNIAGMTLARSVERGREQAMRAALGASPWRLIRALATESLVLALIAGGVGVLLVQWSEILLGFFSLPAPIPQRLQFAVSGRMLGVMGVLVLLAAFLPIVVPARHLRRRDLVTSVRSSGQSGGPGEQRSRRVFVRLQVAGSMFFLALGLLVTQSFTRALSTDPGFDPEKVALLQVAPALAGRTGDAARLLVDRVITRIGTSPSVAAVAAADRVPFYVGFPDRRRVSTSAQPCVDTACPESTNYAVTGSFFAAMGIPVVAGRTFDEQSVADASAVMVNQTAAARFWPDGPAVGQVFFEGDERIRREVVGLVADTIHRGFNETPVPAVYRVLSADEFARPVTILARAAGEAQGGADALTPILIDALRAEDSSLPPSLVQTMRQQMALPLWVPRVTAGLFGLCGVLAMVLATVGLFGTTWYSVNRRTREFGIRLAIGATTTDVRRLVIVEGVRMAAPAIVVGLLAAAVLAHLGRASLVGISSLDPMVYGGAALFQLLTIVGASWWPARRASRVDPQQALISQ
jgi:predicted permease